MAAQAEATLAEQAFADEARLRAAAAEREAEEARFVAEKEVAEAAAAEAVHAAAEQAAAEARILAEKEAAEATEALALHVAAENAQAHQLAEKTSDHEPGESQVPNKTTDVPVYAGAIGSAKMAFSFEATEPWQCGLALPTFFILPP